MNSEYRTTQSRIPPRLFTRKPESEAKFGIGDIRLYGYVSGERQLRIVGEVFAAEEAQNASGGCFSKEFCLWCTVYGNEDAAPILATMVSEAYGDGLVTSIISPVTAFNGFPFAFDVFDVDPEEIREIRIVPADSY